MRHRLVHAALAAAAIAVALLYHKWLPAPQSTMTAVLGVRERLPVDDRYCRYGVRDVAGVTIPTGAVGCVWARTPDSVRRARYEQVWFGIVSRRVRRVERSWNVRGQEHFAASLDSAREALRAQRGEPIPCRSTRGTDDQRVREQWRFPGFFVDLYAGAPSPPPPRLGGDTTSWGLVVFTAERRAPTGC